MKNCYETEIECLNSEILSLQSSLQTMSNKYKSAENEIKEHILAMDNLVKSSKFNEERFESLLKYQYEYQCSMSGPLGTVCVNNMTRNSLSKWRKYESLSDDYIFVPFAVETIGPWGPRAVKFLKKLYPRLVVAAGDKRAGSFLAQRLSIAIQRGNAASVLGTMPRGVGLYDN